MNYQKITSEVLDKLRSIVGADFVLHDEESLKNYSRDETEDLSYPPEVVVKPRAAKEISEILKICNDLFIVKINIAFFGKI